MESLTNALICVLKAQVQQMKAMLNLRKEGISPQFLVALDETLRRHELLKVKLDEFKERKKGLALQLAERIGSQLVTRVGNVVVLFRPGPIGKEQAEQ